jgi:xylulokinase
LANGSSRSSLRNRLGTIAVAESFFYPAFMHILALDIGTSSVKAAVLDVATATPIGPIRRAGYDLDFPDPDAAEVPAGRVWDAVVAAARQVTELTDGIEAVGLSCLMPALVLLDAADQPLMPVWTHLDRRARPAARQVWASVGAEFLRTVGNRPLPGGISAVCWRQQLHDQPKLGGRVRRYLHLNGWLGLMLTGEAFFDSGNASFTGLYGTVTDQRWSEHWCNYFEVDPAWLPPVVSGDVTIGCLRPEAAAQLGLPAGLPVKLGTADTSSAMLAAGMGPRDLLHVVGTTQVLAAFVDQPHPHPHRLTRQLGVGDRYVYVTHNPVGGVALEWLHGLCFRDQTLEQFFKDSVPAARKRATRVSLNPPYLGGDRLEIAAHRAAFRDLTLTTDRLDLLAAVLEAMQRHHRAALEALDDEPKTGTGLLTQESCRRFGFERVFLTGGGADVVRHLLPEYASAQVLPLEEGSLRGVARLWDRGE